MLSSLCELSTASRWQSRKPGRTSSSARRGAPFDSIWRNCRRVTSREGAFWIGTRWKEKFVGNLSAVFPPGNFENWAFCQTMLSHAQAVMPLKMVSREASLQRATVMYHVSWYARKRDASVAERMSKLCNLARMKLLGEDHPDPR